MERALCEVGYSEKDIERMMRELMGASDRSKEEGQAQWKKTRAAVLRRQAEADAYAKAEQLETEAMKSYTERRKRSSPIVAEWVTQAPRSAKLKGLSAVHACATCPFRLSQLRFGRIDPDRHQDDPWERQEHRGYGGSKPRGLYCRGLARGALRAMLEVSDAVPGLPSSGEELNSGHL